MNDPVPPDRKTEKPVDLGLGGDAGFPLPPELHPAPPLINQTPPPAPLPTSPRRTSPKPSRRKIVIGLFYLSLLGVGLLLGLEVTRQRQEIRKFAQVTEVSPPPTTQPPKSEGILKSLETLILWVRLGLASLTTPK